MTFPSNTATIQGAIAIAVKEECEITFNPAIGLLIINRGDKRIATAMHIDGDMWVIETLLEAETNATNTT